MKTSFIATAAVLTVLFSTPGFALGLYHSADVDQDNQFSLSELLRVIQFYNAGEYRCAIEETEDGFALFDGPIECFAHDSDYDRQDWQISLSELLRAVQIFNIGAYHADCTNEDNFDVGEGDPVVCGAPLLPDLIAVPDAMYNNEFDTTHTPGSVFLRFDSSTPNIGLGQFLVRNTGIDAGNGRMLVDHLISRPPGPAIRRSAGDFRYNPDGDHMESNGWVAYRIRQLLPENGVGPILINDGKFSVRITSTTLYDGTLPNVPPPSQRIFGVNGIQGISVGYTDLYPRFLEDQWVDITGLPAGDYWLEMEVDPGRQLLESNEENNIARIIVSIPSFNK